MSLMLDDILDMLPTLRTFRQLDADTLRRLLGRKRGECTWCGNKIGRYRRTWCSDECVAAFKRRCCSAEQRDLVLRRDAGICQECGRNIKESIAAAGRMPHDREAQHRWEARARELGWGRRCWFEVDHIMPVCEGGGLCDIDNLRLVCGACHEAATTRLAAKRKGS